MPEASTLCLVPTPVEEHRLVDQGGFPSDLALVRLCGFGPVAAAARASQLLAELRPQRVLLVGIAGAYDVESHPVGEAFEPDAVALHGVGAGEGEDHLGPPALGFPQWPGENGEGSIEDRLRLAAPDGADGLLLTTCAASSNPAEAALRHARFPDAVAEDMEAFAVAIACTLAGVPCRVIRGISNLVGDRDPAHWRIPSALAAARRLALVALEGEGWGGPS